jgi:sulfite exporter TauE/SafE
VTGADSIVGVYRVMRRLYPRRFRDDYGDDMESLGAVLAMLIWRRERPARAQRDLAGRGWTLLACGAVLLAIVIAATTAAGELSQPAWAAAALALLVAVTLLGTGVVLGFVRLADRRRCARGAT